MYNQHFDPHCIKCRRRYRPGAKDGSLWNAEIRDGLIQWVICPDCQTPEQNLEAMVKEALLDYYRDAAGRIRGRIKRSPGR